MNTTIVIPHKLGRDLSKTLESLPDVPVITIDDIHKEGACVCRNIGFEGVMTDYVFFCDDDVVLYGGAIKMLEERMTASTSVVYGNFLKIHGDGRTGSHIAKEWDYPLLKRGNYISNMSLIRCSDFPGYDESLKRLQDWDLWLTIAERGCKFRWVNDMIFETHTNNNGISNKPNFEKWEKIVKEKHGL